MSNKLEEALKRTIKDEFVHGFMDENGTRQYPTIMALAKRHDITNVTLHRHSKKEDWQSEKNKVQSEYEEAVARERLEKMVKNGAVLDDRSTLRVECASKETEINGFTTKSEVASYSLPNLD